jgi:hypothetical protein
LFIVDDDLSVYLKRKYEFYEQNNKESSCLQQTIWVTKALVMRGHREAYKFVKIVSYNYPDLLVFYQMATYSIKQYTFLLGQFVQEEVKIPTLFK